jgi:hypothetical protein
LTPVPTTYSGLRMDTSASNVLTSQRINSHSLLNKAIEKLPARRRCPSVEPKRVFVQIVLEMRGAHSTLMRPFQPPLQQCRHTVDQRQEVFSHHSLFTNHVVHITYGGQIPVPSPSICTHCTARLHAVFNSRYKTPTRRISHLLKTNTSKLLALVFNRYDNQCLPRRSSTPFARFFTPNIRLVSLDNTRQSIPARPHHRVPQPMQPQPRRMITAQPQEPLQPHCADTVLLIGHVPHRPKPNSKRLSGVFKDRPGRNRDLKVALTAPVQSPLRFPTLPMITARASKSVRPSQFKQVLPTSSIGSKSFLEIKNCVRIVFHSLYTISWEWGSQVHTTILLKTSPPFCGLAVSDF